jgi:hypothetical protein
VASYRSPLDAEWWHGGSGAGPVAAFAAGACAAGKRDIAAAFWRRSGSIVGWNLVRVVRPVLPLRVGHLAQDVGALSRCRKARRLT